MNKPNDNSFNILDENTIAGKFMREYIDNNIISLSASNPNFQDGVDCYYSLNGCLNKFLKKDPEHLG